MTDPTNTDAHDWYVVQHPRGDYLMRFGTRWGAVCGGLAEGPLTFRDFATARAAARKAKRVYRGRRPVREHVPFAVVHVGDTGAAL